MKIDPGNSIRITSRSDSRDLFSGLKKGAEISANIISRDGRHAAQLEVAGRRLHADFTGGVPAGDRVMLRMESVRGGSCIFRLVPGETECVIPGKIFEMSVFSKNILEKIGRPGIFTLLKFLSNPGNTVFSINLFLSNLLKKKETGNRDPGGVMEKLIKKGLGKETLTGISHLLMPGRGGLIIQCISYFQDDFIFRNGSQHGDIREIVEKIISEIEQISPENEKWELIESIIREIMKNSRDESGYSAGILPFFDNGMYRPLSYIRDGGAWLYSLDLSHLGTVDVLARKNMEKQHITIYVYGENTYKSMTKRLKELHADVQAHAPGLHLDVVRTDIILNKIVEIYSPIDFSSVFDVRV